MKALNKKFNEIVDVEPFYLAVKNYDAAGMHPAHYNRFIGFIDSDRNVYERTELEFSADLQEQPEANDYAHMNIKDFNISVRAKNCVRNAFMQFDCSRDFEDITLGEVAQHTRLEYLKIRNFGKKSLNEVEKLLENHDLKFAE